jgi:hypothetical protein
MLSGTGQIRANGGNSSYVGRAGGGGRIAIYYRDATAFNLSNVTALAGTGGIEGQNGTVFAQQQTAWGHSTAGCVTTVLVSVAASTVACRLERIANIRLDPAPARQIVAQISAFSVRPT